MYTWFTVKVKMGRQTEEGAMKTVSEPFMVDAMSFTEAEKRVLEEARPYTQNGELEVAGIQKTRVAEMFYNEDGDKWYRCKVNLLVPDESKGIEKKVGQFIMVQATDLENALKTLIERMKGTLSDYEIALIQETNILDVFPYQIPGAKEDNPTVIVEA